MKFLSTLGLIFLFLGLSNAAYAQAPTCEYTLEMFDSFGDGWNGATLTVIIDGQPTLYSVTTADNNGFSRTVTLVVSTGQPIVFIYTPGIFEGENTYRLRDPDGNIIFSDGPFPAVGIVFTGTASCPTCPALSAASVAALDVRAFTARIGWVPNDLQATYIIEFDTTGFALGDGNMALAFGNTANLTGLSENTDYQYYITTICANGDTSNTVGPFSFKTLWANDVGIVALNSPISGCGLSATEQISVTIRNFGGNPQSLIPMGFSVNGQVAPVNIPLDGFYTGVLGKDSTDTFLFDLRWDFSEPGEYVIRLWTQLPADSLLSNDTLTITIFSLPVIDELPYFEDFETWSGGWRVGPASVNSSWQFGEPAAPLLNTAASGQNAWVTNLTGNYNNSEMSYLESPCIDFSSLTEDPRLVFSLWFDSEACCDEGWVEHSIDGGQTWTKVGTSGTGLNWYNDAGNQWWDGTGGFTGWVTAFNTLTGTAGQADVRIRFVFSSDGSVIREGMGVDNIFIAQPVARDLFNQGATYTPAVACGTETGTVGVNIFNLGTEAQTGFDVAYSINGGPPVVENVGALNIAPNGQTTYTFNNTLFFDQSGTYTIRVWTDLAGDLVLANDTTSLVVNVELVPIITDYPYFTDFETGSGGWKVAPNSTNSTWQFGQPAAPMLNAAASGQNAWVTNLTGFYNNNELSYLISPCYDFSSLTADPRLSFSLWFDSEACCDEGWVERSIDGGQTWTKVGTSGTGLNWYNDDFNQWWDGIGGFTGWVTAFNTLTGTAGQANVRIRFVFSSDGSVVREGMGIDNVRISQPLANDLSNTGVVYSAASSCGTESGTVRINILNFGSQPQTGFDVSYSINGGPPVVENVGALNIAPNAQATYTFTTPITFDQNGVYNITAWTSLTDDQALDNDTTSVTINVELVPIIPDFPYFENFESGNGGWRVAPISMNSSWQFGQPAAPLLNTAASGQNAWVTNLTGFYNNNEMSYLVSPCFDFSSLSTDPRLSFSLWFDSEACCDEGWVERSIDGGQTWAKVGTAGAGQNWYNDNVNQWWDGTGNFTGWVTAFNTLTGTAGQANVRIRFVFSSDGSVVREGMGIDDVFIALPLAIDLAAVTASNASGQPCGQPNDQVSVTITNLGSTAQTGFDVGYSVNGGPPVIENVGALSIPPNGQATYTFMTTFNSSMPATYTIVVWTTASGEQFAANDTTTFVFQSAIPVPYFEDFEGGVLPQGWTADPDVFITNAHGNTSFVMADNLWSGDQEFSAATPAVGLISLNDTLRFDYRIVNFSGANVPTVLGPGNIIEISISTDCGETYEVIHGINSTNHTPTAAMTTVRLPLADYADEVIRVRFSAAWASGDYWLDFDNINISSEPSSTIEFDRISKVTLAPNPTNGLASLEIRFSEPVDAHIAVLDMMGRPLASFREQRVESAVYPLDLSRYPAGIYFVRIMADNQVRTLKLVRTE